MDIPADLSNVTSSALAGMRASLVARGKELDHRLSQLGKATPERVTLTDEKVLVQRHLTRVNAETKRRHVASPGGDPHVDRTGFPPLKLPTAESLEVLRLCAAILSGPSAGRYFGTNGIDADTLVVDAGAVYDEVMGDDEDDVDAG